MYLRRAVSKTLALPLRAPPCPTPLGKDASLRRVSSSKFPGTSGSNMIYYLVVGVTVSAGGYYTYKAVTSKQVRHTERVTDVREQTKPGLQPLAGEKENVAEAGKARSGVGEISEKEIELVYAEEVPELAAGPPEESPASGASLIPGEDALVETSILREEPELKITETCPWETTEGVPEPTTEVENSALESTAEVECAAPEPTEEVASAGPEPTTEVESTAPEATAEAESSAQDQADVSTEDTDGKQSCEESAELEESPPLGSEPSAQCDSQ
ncbi:protein MGARP [Cricetulus griseus]|nr:protein MGARP [Cricetulus griseus]XP_027250739.1 protein MGARP [Cricetulus griseus]